jgi:hypothetical protein
MDYIFYQVAAINGFDSFGHYLRAGLLVNLCVNYSVDPVSGCSARFNATPTASSAKATPASLKTLFGTDKATAKTVSNDTTANKDAKAGRSPIKLPDSLLPGDPSATKSPTGGAQQVTPQQPPSQQGTADSSAGLLDYLFGGG